MLRESPSASASTEMQSSGGLTVAAVFAAPLVIATLASLQSPTMLVPIGLLTFLVGRIWFAMQVLREMAPPNALMVLFVPFMPTIFFFQRIDITWKPFVYGIMGIVMLFMGLSAPRP